MKKYITEKNIAGVLFLFVLIAFSLAHEDSKKRQTNYKSFIPDISTKSSHIPIAVTLEKSGTAIWPVNEFDQK